MPVRAYPTTLIPLSLYNILNCSVRVYALPLKSTLRISDRFSARRKASSEGICRITSPVADMQDYVQSAQYNLQFQLHNDSSRMVVKVTEIASGEVIRQIPSEEALRLADNLSEIRSVLFSGKA